LRLSSVSTPLSISVSPRFRSDEKLPREDLLLKIELLELLKLIPLSIVSDMGLLPFLSSDICRTDSPLLELPLLLLLVLLATLPLETTVRGRSAARTLAFWPGKFLYRGSVSAYPGNVELAKHPVVVAPPRADEILLQSPRMSYA